MMKATEHLLSYTLYFQPLKMGFILPPGQAHLQQLASSTRSSYVQLRYYPVKGRDDWTHAADLGICSRFFFLLQSFQVAGHTFWQLPSSRKSTITRTYCCLIIGMFTQLAAATAAKGTQRATRGGAFCKRWKKRFEGVSPAYKQDK